MSILTQAAGQPETVAGLADLHRRLNNRNSAFCGLFSSICYPELRLVCWEGTGQLEAVYPLALPIYCETVRP